MPKNLFCALTAIFHFREGEIYDDVDYPNGKYEFLHSVINISIVLFNINLFIPLMLILVFIEWFVCFRCLRQ